MARRRVFHAKHRRVWNPLADWDGIALWSDGKTNMEIVKLYVEADMAIFDRLPKRARDQLNEEGGISEEYIPQQRQTTGGY